MQKKKSEKTLYFKNMTNNYSKIKMELLKSGLPLESMVADSIESISKKLPHPLLNTGEYFFERDESERPHSVDFQIMYDLDIPNCDFLEIAFLIECKYRVNGTSWYFVENYLNDAGQEFFVENFFSKGKCNRKNFPVLTPPLGNDKLPIAGKGIEIYANGERNDKSITEGIHQLMFACCESLNRAFFSEISMKKPMLDRKIDITNRSWHSLLCPLLVTNSTLNYLKNPNIESIEKSEKIEDICTQNNLILFSTPRPPPYVSNFINENVFKAVKGRFLPQELSESRLRTYLFNMSTLNPSRYYIINYEIIESFIEHYIEFASSLLTYASKRG